MQFVLNDRLVKQHGLDADLSLLRYLREHQHLCGTKEGCASGDCGACTVLIGSLDGDRIHYQSVNACITPTAAVDKQHVVTVEHLNQCDKQEGGEKNTGENLHPAQRQMVQQHGSQCGFCTPGFVMSLAGLYENTPAEKAITRAEVCDAISGNLCRCTGYIPIVEAGLAMQSCAPQSLFNDAIVAQLRAIAGEGQHSSQRPHYLKPHTLAELREALSQHRQAKIIAGGTDLMLVATQHYQSLEILIDVSEVDALKLCRVNDDNISLGAALTYSAIEEKLGHIFPALVQFLTRLGSRQIRNRGTLGGNIVNASPVADIPPVLLALDALLEICDSSGNSRTVPLKDFYLDYKKTQLRDNEFLVATHFRRSALEDFHRLYKISKRLEDDISSVMAAIRFQVVDGKISACRIAYGGMAACPIRAYAAEQTFVGKACDDASALHQALEDIAGNLRPMSDVRASADYRMAMAKNLLRKAWMALNHEEIPGISGDEGPVHA